MKDTTSNTKKNDDDYAIGQFIRHTKFGTGEIVKVIPGEAIKVLFGKTTRILLLKYNQNSILPKE